MSRADKGRSTIDEVDAQGAESDERTPVELFIAWLLRRTSNSHRVEVKEWMTRIMP